MKTVKLSQQRNNICHVERYIFVKVAGLLLQIHCGKVSYTIDSE